MWDLPAAGSALTLGLTTFDPFNLNGQVYVTLFFCSISMETTVQQQQFAIEDAGMMGVTVHDLNQQITKPPCLFVTENDHGESFEPS